jgi:hypothetical protein
MALKEEASVRVHAVKGAYEGEISKLKKRYVQDIGTLEDHAQVLEEKLVKLHIDLNGEENIDDLEIPSYELAPLRIAKVNVNASNFSKNKNMVEDNNSCGVSWSSETIDDQDDEIFSTGSPGGSPNKSARDIISRVNSFAPNGSILMKNGKGGGHEHSEIKRDNRVLRTKMKELGRVRSPCALKFSLYIEI